MAVVYKITRLTDSKEYVGIATVLRNRLYQHKKSERFANSEISVEILHEGHFNECQKLEPKFIEKYDTYFNGLNKTIDGGGCHNYTEFFSTYGYKFSEASKEKMRKAFHKRFNNGTHPFCKQNSIHNKKGTEIYEKWRKGNSKAHLGKTHSYKISKETKSIIRKDYKNFIEGNFEIIECSIVISMVKKSHIFMVEGIDKKLIYKLISEGILTMKNGKPLTLDKYFANVKNKEINITGGYILKFCKTSQEEFERVVYL